MGTLDGIAEKSFIDQVQILNSIEQHNDPAEITGLFPLLTRPLADQAVQGMVEDVLRKLLGRNEDELLKLLAEPGLQKAEKIFLLKVVRRFAPPAAAPVLEAIYREENEPEIRNEIAWARAALPDDRKTAFFRPLVNDPDPVLAARAIELLGAGADRDSLPTLFAMVEAGNSDTSYHECSLQLAQAIESIALIGSEEAVSFLTTMIHHRNPTARRFVHEQLQKIGEAAFPGLERAFLEGDDDNMIMAANILGQIAERRGADIMIAALDAGRAGHINVRFAIYEALGKIKSIKGLVCLLDAMASEEEPLVLLAAVSGLEEQVNPMILERLAGIFKADPDRAARLAGAIVSSVSLNVFKALYARTENKSLFRQAFLSLQDKTAIAAFSVLLEQDPDPQAALDLAALRSVAEAKGCCRVLAVDDSRSVLILYRNLLGECGCQVETAENGLQGWDRLQDEADFQLILSDLNMPLMNGIELLKKVREQEKTRDLPFVLVTTEADQSQLDLARRCGVTDYLVKPFKKEQLLTLLEKYISG